GITGAARFRPQGDTQLIDVRAALQAASLDLPAATTVRQGDVTASLRIRPDGNSVKGRYDLSGVTFGTLALSTATGAFDLQNGEGRVSADVKGRRGVPFAANIAAEIGETAISLTGTGDIAGDMVRLDRPARITRGAAGWQLADTTLTLPRGKARLSGNFGDVPTLDLDLDRAGLGALSLALPGVELGGEATGDVSLTFPPGGLPQGRARLRVTDFARESGVLAQPIDLALIAILSENSAALRAAFEQDGKRVGRFQARLPSLPGTSETPWADRIANAPISAQLRYRGPAEAIWPLGGVDAIGIGGPLAARIDIAGIVSDPSLTGTLTSENLSFESVASGTVIQNIDLAARFTGSRLQLERFTGRDRRDGTISGSGTVDLSLSRGFPIDVRLDTQNAQLIDIDTLDTRVTGPILIRNSPEAGARISGDLNVDRARYQPGNPAAEEIPELKVREVNTALVRARTAPPARTVWQLDVKAAANNRIYVRGLGLDSEWSANLLIKGPVNEPRLSGQADLLRGDYDFAGRRFELTRGEVIFNGRYPPDPTLNIAAESRVEGLTATIAIRGLSTEPEILLSSVPSLPQDEILSRVLFGTSIANLSAPEALQLAGAVAALRGGGSSALDPIGSVRRAIGIDRLRITAANAATGEGTGVAAGEYLGRRTYVEVTADTDGNTATQIEYALTRAFSILGRVSSFGGNSIGVRVSKDY
ncbi:MAG: translocation/assembly module TamB domain-containing protein, partial [Pacificimonas sp.]